MSESANNSSLVDSSKFHMTLASFTWGIAFAVVGVLISIANLLILLIFSLNSRLRRRSFYCLLNLAAADILVGCVGMPLYSSYFFLDKSFYSKHGLMLLHATDIVYNFTSNMSMFSLVLISIERMLATVRPWSYRNTHTRVFIIAIVVTWAVGMTQGVLYYVMKYIIQKQQSLLAVLAPILFLSIAIICASYLTIYLKAKSSHLHDRHLEGSCCHLPNHQQQRSLRRANQRERELAITLFIVTVSSLISWLPYALMQMFFIRIPIDAVFGITLLQCCNSLMNPVIYVFRMQEFRRALIQFLCKCSRYYPHVSPMDNNKIMELTIPDNDAGQQVPGKGSRCNDMTPQ